MRVVFALNPEQLEKAKVIEAEVKRTSSHAPDDCVWFGNLLGYFKLQHPYKIDTRPTSFTLTVFTPRVPFDLSLKDDKIVYEGPRGIDNYPLNIFISIFGNKDNTQVVEFEEKEFPGLFDASLFLYDLTVAFYVKMAEEQDKAGLLHKVLDGLIDGTYRLSDDIQKILRVVIMEDELPVGGVLTEEQRQELRNKLEKLPASVTN